MTDFSATVYATPATLETAVEAIDNSNNITVIPFFVDGKQKFVLLEGGTNQTANENYSGIVEDEIKAWRDRGYVFLASRLFLNVVAGASVNVAYMTGSVISKIRTSIETSGNCHIYVYEAPTVTAAGTSMNAYNYNRSSTKTLTGDLSYNISFLGGTNIEQGAAFGTSGFFMTGAGDSSDELSKIFDTNTLYVLSIQNVTSGSISIALTVRICELPNL